MRTNLKEDKFFQDVQDNEDETARKRQLKKILFRGNPNHKNLLEESKTAEELVIREKNYKDVTMKNLIC